VKLIAGLLCLLAATSTIAAGIGTVSDNKGTACEIQRNKNKLAGTKGSSIESMDTYVTGACSSNITFKDDTKLRVTENSRLVIDDFVFDPKASDAGKLAVKVGMGTVRYASGQIAKNNPQRVAINTPTATVAVRGTDFTMTVDETGESLIVLVPSCRDESEQKKFELEENRCRVGSIEVRTQAGVVVLDKAFEATYVASNTMMPTPPVIMNTIEGKINNNLIIVRPQEVQQAIKQQARTKRDDLEAELELEAQRRISQKIRETNEAIENARLLALAEYVGKTGCNPSSSVCVNWERSDAPDIQGRGKGVAFRSNEEHYAEVKTSGYSSNTFVSITHNDQYADTIIGEGGASGNIVTIIQNSGVLRKSK
jgi:hypothetical protein